MKVSLDRKTRNLERGRNVFRTIGLIGVGLALYGGISSASLEKPEGYVKYHNLKSHIETIENIQDNHEKLDSSKIYSPSLEKIRDSYQGNSGFYNEAKGEIEDKIKDMETYEIRRYDEKKDKKFHTILAGIGTLAFGLMGASEYGGRYKIEKHLLKVKQKEEKRQQSQ